MDNKISELKRDLNNLSEDTDDLINVSATAEHTNLEAIGTLYDSKNAQLSYR